LKFLGNQGELERSETTKIFVGLGTHLFVKVPQPGDSEVTFLVIESSCHLILPV